jgi:hypothetical protein
MLCVTGILDGSKQGLKARCWNDYKAQMLYIDAMKEAKDDQTYDPRRNEHLTGNDGRFVAAKGKTVPKNPLTVMYLIHAYEVPYATFKRWKADAFVSEKHVPEHKGKSIITDKKWATQIFNPRRMYLEHKMAVWLLKHPSKKYDSKAKKVGIYKHDQPRVLTLSHRYLRCHLTGDQSHLQIEMG